MLRRDNIHEDPTLSSRFECKYLIDPMLAGSVRRFVAPFMRPDPYAAKRDGFRYPISSLYLDSDDLRLYQQTVGGEKNRFKLRIRTYSDEPDDDVFFEVKRKVNNIVRKKRARLIRADAQALLGGNLGDLERPLDAKTDDDLALFHHHAARIGAKPVVRVKYNREAYESKTQDPVRVTLDTELMHAVTLQPDLRHDSGPWVTTPVDGVILEIKFTDNYPTWIHELVRLMGLRQQPVPKYIMSVDHMMLAGRQSSLALAGFTLPPQGI